MQKEGEPGSLQPTVLLTAVGTVLRRPRLWAVALRQALLLRRNGWWLRPPFLPLPDKKYLRFRLQTAYGQSRSGVAELLATDVVTWLEWCRSVRKLSRR